MKFYGPAIVTEDHGETNSVYSVRDSGAPPDEQPAVIRSFSTHQHGLHARGTAQFICDLLNGLELAPETAFKAAGMVASGGAVKLPDFSAGPAIYWHCPVCKMIGIASDIGAAQTSHDHKRNCMGKVVESKHGTEPHGTQRSTSSDPETRKE